MLPEDAIALEQETPAEKNFREISSRKTNLDCDIAEAEEKLRRYIHDHRDQPPTLDVQEKIIELTAARDKLTAELQRILPVYASALWRKNGWME